MNEQTGEDKGIGCVKEWPRIREEGRDCEVVVRDSL